MLGITRTRATLIYVMVNLRHLLKPTVAAFVLCVTVFQPTVAVSQENDTSEITSDGEMSRMMAELKVADAARAEQLAGQIRHLWDASGSATADYLLRRTRKAIDVSEMEAAVEHATALVDHAPEFAQGWAERARAYYALDLYGPALSDLEQVIALNPTHFDAVMGLAIMLDEIGKPEDAYEAYQQVQSIHPHQAGLTEALERLAPLVRGQDL
ncbi:tetratricopeptide repeat protein [uncultured Shimia sp.]|uniref:tetratricopeptide repeat protein n=1 Tax=uncultured Shimia sp. TaxID=573152 RepID=UPI002631AC12|nr:tetratricopeptide repeat protein [uncultured Shimia sp.]